MKTKLRDKDPLESATNIEFEITTSDEDVCVSVRYLSGKPAASISIYVENGTLWVSSVRNHDGAVNRYRVASLY